MAPLRCADLFARMFFYTSKCVFTIRNPQAGVGREFETNDYRDACVSNFRNFSENSMSRKIMQGLPLASDITAMPLQV